MDPYGDHSRKILSPLDKVQVEKTKIGIPVKPEIESDITRDDKVVESNFEAAPSLVDHLTDLRKQLVKSAAVFLFF